MKLQQRKLPQPRIEMLPLIDIVFLLLVFFIYAMLSMAVHHGQAVDLPQSESASLEVNEAIGISIKSTDGNVALFLDEEEVSLNLLAEKLRQKQMQIKQNQKSEVQIFADKNIPYQKLFHVLDRVKQAGITSISLQAEPEGSSP